MSMDEPAVGPGGCLCWFVNEPSPQKLCAVFRHMQCTHTLLTPVQTLTESVVRCAAAIVLLLLPSVI